MERPPHLARFVPRSGATWRDPFGMYAALREHDPVHHVEDGDYWVLSRFADVMAAAQDTTTFSSAQGLTFAYDEMERVGLRAAAPMVMLDPPDHTAFRRLVARGFTPSMVVAHYLGVPAGDRCRFDDWTQAIVGANAAGDAMAAPQAVADLFGYFSELIERRRVEPGDDTISHLVAAGGDAADVPLIRILGFAFTMVAGGNDTTTGLLGGAAELL